jgi:2-methylcitrate dehydratase PrpD
MNAITEIQAGTGLTRALADQASTLQFQDIPDATRSWARQCVLDYLGCGIAGASDQLVAILLAEMMEHGGTEAASVLGIPFGCRWDPRPFLTAPRHMRWILTT